MVAYSLAFAQTTTTQTTTTQATTTTTTTTKPFDPLACVRAYLKKRENSLNEARAKYFDAVNKAYEERVDAITKAWKIESKQQRRKELSKIYKDFKKRSKKHGKTIKIQ
jgi:dihydroxyacetone kinase-like predicted kinase